MSMAARETARRARALERRVVGGGAGLVASVMAGREDPAPAVTGSNGTTPAYPRSARRRHPQVVLHGRGTPGHAIDVRASCRSHAGVDDQRIGTARTSAGPASE